MSAKIINGDLFDSDAKYIVHQCNCVSWRAAHLAYHMFKRFPYANIYKERYERMKAGENAEDTPGDIIIRGNGKDQRYVIAILGQKYPGKPIVSAPEDSFKKRTDYFFSGLQKIAKIPELESIAFPYGVGCGAAGNDWNLYYKLINKFADYVKDDVFIYKLL